MGCGASAARHQEQVKLAGYQYRRASLGMAEDLTALQLLNAKVGLDDDEVKDILPLLRSLALFRHVAPKQLEELMRKRIAQPFHVPDGSVVIEEGSAPQSGVRGSDGLFVL
jgi:hypothetical protein